MIPFRFLFFILHISPPGNLTVVAPMAVVVMRFLWLSKTLSYLMYSSTYIRTISNNAVNFVFSNPTGWGNPKWSFSLCVLLPLAQTYAVMRSTQQSRVVWRPGFWPENQKEKSQGPGNYQRDCREGKAQKSPPWFLDSPLNPACTDLMLNCMP